MTPIGNHSRRAFLKSAAGFAALGAGGPLAMQLASLASASEASAAGGYKALVCVFLNGGNDNFNTLTPSDTANYNALAKLRPDFITPKAKLLSLNGATQNGLSVALHPDLINVRSIYNSGRLAILPNVGVLDEPITRAQIINQTKLQPSSVGSHNDSSSQWHTFGSEGTRHGWGGRMLDSLYGMKKSSFASISVGYFNPFGTGNNTEQFRVYPDGIVENFAGVNKVAYLGSPVGAATVKKFVTESSSENLLRKQYTALTKRTFDGVNQLQSALNEVKNDFLWSETRAGDPGELYRQNDLLYQMRVVARLIKQRAKLDVTRQVFFVELLGFDLHSGIAQQHAGLLRQADVALGYFDDCLGQMGMRDSVMTFTTSEFGRNLPQNGDGTDHGWGGVQFIMGGGVKGGKLYGALPEIGLNSQNFSPTTCLIPTVASAQVVATIGKWFGVSPSTLSDFIPNLKNFSPRYLDFA